jgi:XapX domain-containing protein
MPDEITPPKKSMNAILLEILLALAVGFVVGLVFSACKLPLPSPPVLAGVMGIVGIYLGGKCWPLVAERFFS